MNVELQENESKLIRAWISVSNDSAKLEQHLSKLRKVDRIRERCALGISRSRDANVIDARSTNYLFAASQCGIKFKKGSCLFVAICQTYRGVPDSVLVLTDIWDGESIEIVEVRAFEALCVQEWRLISLENLPAALSSSLKEKGISSFMHKPWSETVLEDHEWITQSVFPSLLRHTLSQIGSFQAGGLSVADNGPEVWHFPEMDVLPIFTSASGQFFLGVQLNDRAQLVVFDQSQAEFDLFENDFERAFAQFASLIGKS